MGALTAGTDGDTTGRNCARLLNKKRGKRPTISDWQIDRLKGGGGWRSENKNQAARMTGHR